jgi:hypothetical protein
VPVAGSSSDAIIPLQAAIRLQPISSPSTASVRLTSLADRFSTLMHRRRPGFGVGMGLGVSGGKTAGPELTQPHQLGRPDPNRLQPVATRRRTRKSAMIARRMVGSL